MLRNLRSRAAYLAWRKFLHRYPGWSRARYDRLHDYEVRRNGTCAAGWCDRCAGVSHP